MESLYKVGDVVKVKQLSIDDSHKYKYGLNLEMVRFSGKSVEITEVIEYSTPDDERLPDDGFRYRLKGSRWNWVSSMFEESPRVKKLMELKSKTSKIKISFHKKKKLKFNYNL